MVVVYTVEANTLWLFGCRLGVRGGLVVFLCGFGGVCGCAGAGSRPVALGGVHLFRGG